MTWLRHAVPIALLADLLDPAGPPSREIYRSEAVAADVRRETALLAAEEVPKELGVKPIDFTAQRAG